jgi:hypothetical protein
MRSRTSRWLTLLRRALGPPPPPARRYFSSANLARYPVRSAVHRRQPNVSRPWKGSTLTEFELESRASKP